MKVLFITEKYIDHNNPSKGMTNNMVNLIGSYECANVGDFKHLFITPEPGDIWSVGAMDKALLEEEYDLAVVSHYSYNIPSFEVCKQIGKKLVLCWWDTVMPPKDRPCGGYDSHQGFESFCSRNAYPPPAKSLNEYASACMNIIFDHGRGFLKDNMYAMSVPQDSRVYFPSENSDKKIEVSFVGSVEGRPFDRMPILQRLQASGIPVTIAGRENGTGNLSPQEYAGIIRDSKISLNFQIGHWAPHRKGRIFEIAASNSFMLTNYPDNVFGFFDEKDHFGSFDENDVVSKIEYWLSNNQEREQRAAAMYNHYKNNYSPSHWWNELFNVCL